MTRYTNGNGKIILICDQCRNDLSQGDNVYVLTLSKVEDGYSVYQESIKRWYGVSSNS